ncbi:hypothetical protein RclHR1_12550004 [Rhizophagus clarus]|uniref:Uncharacterized protein n=1 Tax=Rhizophagus clarus TaxID=94130 RepID=A0A2Z6Q959_9GLOM|nr:hypothetical protein RclHR1_12550004 [Rhizophagus clarus]GES89580.1 hypothetical protein GLOIN_2v1715483 [Rhizophagus clarus]
MELNNYIIVFPDFFTIITIVLISQAITTCYYAYNVFGRRQMQLRNTLYLTPARREFLAYDEPQTGPLASIITTIILTVIVHEIQYVYKIENYSTAIIINLFLWFAASALSFTRYISYNLPALLFLIDTLHDCVQLIGIAIAIQYFINKNY